MRTAKVILWAAMLSALLCVPSRRALAQGDADAFQKITLKQVMGTGWTEFERTFAALTADPRNDEAFQEMSVVVGEAGALNKVTPYLEALVQQHPEDTTLRTILGRVYKDLTRDPVRAREHFEAVLKSDPEDFFAHYQLAALFARQGDKGYSDAVAHYRTAAEKVTRQFADLRTRILTELGELLYSRRETDPKYAQEAFAAWDATTSGIRQFDLQTYEMLADLYRSRALWAKVQETYERYFAALGGINDTPENVVRCRLRTRIGEACENQELYGKAIDAYAEAVGLLEQNTWQRRKLAGRIRECWEKLGKASDYERDLRKAVEDNPNSIAVRQSLSRMLLESGRPEEAAAMLETARQMAPRNVPMLNTLEGIYRSRTRRDDDALARILRARIELSPEDFNAYVDLADLHVSAGRTGDAGKVLSELESSPSELPEKFLLLARAYARYGMARPAFVLYKRLVDGSDTTAEERFEFCDFCLEHDAFKDEALAQAARLSKDVRLEANGYVRLSDIFRKHDRNDEALAILLRGLSACGKHADGTENRPAVFALNSALSDLEHRMGTGHHAQALSSTLTALLAAPDLHFKRLLNDRLVTLLTNYGHRQKLLYSTDEESGDPRFFGGPKGAGIAPWVDFLNVQANSREDADLWMLLGQVNETVEVDAELPPKVDTKDAPPRRVKTDLPQARLCFQKVVDMEFQNLDAHVAMARVLADPAVDEYEKAVNEFEVLALLNPVTRWESIQAVGDLYANAGETVLARERWRIVAEQSASEPDLLEQIAMRMFRAGDLRQALDLAGQTVTISPYVFRYRAACANLLARAAATDRGTDLPARYVAEMNEALRLAQASPGLADFAPQVKRGLFEGRTLLAQRLFERGDFKEAREQFESAAKLVTPTAAAADTEVQVARCDEALGDRAGALKRYADILKDKPEIPCWVSTGVSVSGRSFLFLKQNGELVDGERETSPKPSGGAVMAQTLPGTHVHDPVCAFLALPNGKLLLEGARRRHRMDTETGRAADSSERPEPLDAVRATLLLAGEDRAVMVQGNSMRALRLGSGDILWTRPATDVDRYGRPESVRTTGRLVVIAGARGIQTLRADTGQMLWERMGDGMQFDVNDRLLALLAPAGTGDKELLTLEPESGAVIARRTISASALWHPPALAGEIVLLTDSLNGNVFGFDARTCRDRFTFALGTSPISPLKVLGDVAVIHALRDGAVNVAILDLKRLRIRFDVPLRADKVVIDGLSVPPLAWKDRLLYLDGATGTVLALRVDAGTVEALAPDAAGMEALSRSTFNWCLSGDTLCFVGSEGVVQMRRLSASMNRAVP